MIKHYERYRINGDKNKELLLTSYLHTVRHNVVELITKKNIGERKFNWSYLSYSSTILIMKKKKNTHTVIMLKLEQQMIQIS